MPAPCFPTLRRTPRGTSLGRQATARSAVCSGEASALIGAGSLDEPRLPVVGGLTREIWWLSRCAILVAAVTRARRSGRAERTRSGRAGTAFAPTRPEVRAPASVAAPAVLPHRATIRQRSASARGQARRSERAPARARRGRCRRARRHCCCDERYPCRQRRSWTSSSERYASRVPGHHPWRRLLRYGSWRHLRLRR